MPAEKADTATVNSLMSEKEAEGRARQWVRDIKDAHEVFWKRLPLVTNITGARRGKKMRSIKRLAERVLAPAFVLCRNTNQGCEIYLMAANEKGQLKLVKMLVDHSGQIENLTMNFILSLHCILRFLQYWRVREKNPMKHRKVNNLMALLPQADGQTPNSKIVIHDDDGVRAEICCAVEEFDDGTCVCTATTFIIDTSLYPKHLRVAEEMRHRVEKRGFKKGKPGTEVLKDTEQND